MALKLLLLSSSLLLLLLLLPSSLAQSPVKAAYWFPGGVGAASIDSTLFSHLFCAFATLDPSTFTLLSLPTSFSNFTSTVRRKNPNVLTLLSIGGGNSDPTDFSHMASTQATRKSFIDSSISLARANAFSGLDLDWEGDFWSASDMTNLASLLSEWRAAVQSESSSSGEAPLLLTAALYYSSSKHGVKYPVSSLSKNLDWVNIMDYDFYGPIRTPVTAAHAGLYNPAGGFSGSRGVAGWISSGMPANKIVLGLPYYGYAWALSDANNHGLGARATGLASGTGIDTQYGSIVYNAVRDFIADNNASTVYNATVVANYCYAGTTWIGYDDVEAVGAKVGYAKGKGLRGYSAWSVSGDDNWVLSKKALSTWG